jgi:tripartite-type tricarboxylate transporter receptor subunit TctC
MSEDWDIALPPFKPDEALLRLRRDLRELGLSEREGRFERKGEVLARAAVSADSTQLLVAMVKRPARSPDWQERTLRDGAQLREFVADLKKKLAQWSDRDE